MPNRLRARTQFRPVLTALVCCTICTAPTAPANPSPLLIPGKNRICVHSERSEEVRVDPNCLNIADFLGRLWTVPDRFEIGFRLFPQAVLQPPYFSLSAHSAWQSSAPPTNSAPLKVRPDDASTREGFARFYNNDYEAAITLIEQAQKNHPDDPFAANHLLQAVLVQELEREGALSAQLYAGNDFLRTKKVSVSPQVRARIQDLISRSIGLSEQRLKANPRDADALYTLGAARALRAIYEGLIDKSWFPALHSALAAYRDHQQVLEISPHYDDAKLVVGVYNYVVAALPLYEKIAAFLLAITGSKSKGIEDVSQAANAGGEASIDAKTALSLFLAREHQYPEAVQLMRGLYASYPHNFHFGLWEGDLLRASGSYPESVAAYRNLLSLAQQGYFPNARIAKAAYGLGESLRAQSKYGDAAESFESAAQFSGADSQMAVRSKLSAGKMYDLQQRRDLAVKNYDEVLALAPDSTEAQEARRLLKQPYRNP